MKRTLEEILADAIAPLLADGRGADRNGNPRIGRATKKKAATIASTVLACIHGEGLSFYRQGNAPGDLA